MDPKVSQEFLGRPVGENAAEAKMANPIAYITPDGPHFLIVHGTDDHIVPPRQSEFLQVALKRAGVEDELEYVIGAGHDIDQTQTPEIADLVTKFFDKNLRGNQHLRDDIGKIGEPTDCWVDIFPDNLKGTQYKLYATASRGPHTESSYRVYLPPDYDLAANARRRYPVIYFLHGAGGDSPPPCSTAIYLVSMRRFARA